MTILTLFDLPEVDDEFRPTGSPDVTVHVGSGLAGTLRADGKWRPLPFGSCATCGSNSGVLRAGLKHAAPSIQCPTHRDAKWRKARPDGVNRWPFEANMVLPQPVTTRHAEG